MSDWVRVGDDQVLQLSDRTYRFLGPKGEYTITWQKNEQNSVIVQILGETEIWTVNLKEVRGADYKISGHADTAPQILSDSAWFELVISPNSAKTTYWGDGVVVREDCATN